jgi:hypothetical protein
MDKMEVSNEWRFCTLCKQPYSFDTSASTDNRDESSSINDHAELNLNRVIPVQSVACSHILCLLCVQQQASALTTTAGDDRRIIQCPICWTDKAFDANNPIISVITCDLLNELQTLSLARSKGKENSSAIKESRGQPENSSNQYEQLNFEQNQPQDCLLCSFNDKKECGIHLGNQVSDVLLTHSEFQRDENSNPKTEDNDDFLLNKTSKISPTTEHTAVIHPSQPGAFYVQGIAENAHETTDEELHVAEARMIDEIPTVHAEAWEPQPPFYKKYRYWLIGVFVILIILSLIVLLSMIIPKRIRNKKLLAIVLNVSNQSSIAGLGEPQSMAKTWILGPHNFGYDPTRNHDQLAQRYVCATLCWSLGCENFALTPADNECNWLPELVHCSSSGKIINITIGKQSHRPIFFCFGHELLLTVLV